MQHLGTAILWVFFFGVKYLPYKDGKLNSGQAMGRSCLEALKRLEVPC